MKAVYVDDSKRFHKFQIVDGNMVGSIYVPKGTDIPKSIPVELISKAHPDYATLRAQVPEKRS